MNSKENNSGTNLTNHSYEEDNCSNYSGESQVSARPDAVSQELKEQPIRVRDMIKLYNYATQKNQELEFAKSAYFGNNPKAANQQQSGDEYCHNMSNMQHSQPEGGSSNMASTFRLTTMDDKTSLQQSMHSGCADGKSGEGESIEKSYQSKTTIRRTEQGVRIIIDIFFDKQESELDIIGSRVETDIPESRILADFQQHSLGMRSQNVKETTHV